MVVTGRQTGVVAQLRDAVAAMHDKRHASKLSLTPEVWWGPALFLASDASRSITAQSIIVDGGVF